MKGISNRWTVSLENLEKHFLALSEANNKENDGSEPQDSVEIMETTVEKKEENNVSVEE